MKADNKQKMINALLSTKRLGIKNLIEHMEQIGFFESPCSGGNHLAKEGGLLEHSLNVMEYAYRIGSTLLGESEYKKIENSVIIAAALHDLGKCGQFGKPNYVPNILKSGKASDTKPFKTNPDLLYVDHEVRSVAIAMMYIDLTEEEQFAIIYHNGLYGPLKYSLTGKETPLYMIIHWSDMWASRVVEEGK